MRIIRFLDGQGRVSWGRDLGGGRAIPLRGDPWSGLEEGGGAVRVAKLLAPLQPAAIFGIGLNYRCHARETGMDEPASPVVFMKNPAAVQNPGDPIILPESCLDRPQVDYEVELALVIGRPARDVAEEDAPAHLAGYTVGNDVSARIWQKRGGGGQWIRGKSFDTFCPLGPALVTPEEIPDPLVLGLRTLLNGEVMQESNTAEMIFSPARLVAELSRGMTLLPGTVILTGTPGGVGFVRRPPVYLQPGDRVTLQVEGIGELTNPVVSAREWNHRS